MNFTMTHTNGFPASAPSGVKGVRRTPFSLFSFDIDGTLGKQKHPPLDDSFDTTHTVEITGDEFGRFTFFRGAIECLQFISRTFPDCPIILVTAGVKTQGCPSDRNLLIQEYIQKVLGRVIPLYGIADAHIFQKKDIQAALAKEIPSYEWQKWFDAVFSAHPPHTLHTTEEENERFASSYFLRDHSLILPAPDTTVLHVDDSPHTIIPHVSVFPFPRETDKRALAYDEIVRLIASAK